MWNDASKPREMMIYLRFSSTDCYFHWLGFKALWQTCQNYVQWLTNIKDPVGLTLVTHRRGKEEFFSAKARATLWHNLFKEDIMEITK